MNSPDGTPGKDTAIRESESDLENTRVKNIELAEVQAYEEDPYINKIMLAEQLGLSAEKIEELEAQKNEKSQEKAEKCLKAMKVAEELFMKLVDTGENVDFEAEFNEARKDGYVDELRDAIDAKTRTIDKEGRTITRIFKNGSIKWIILRSESMSEGHILKITEVKVSEKSQEQE